MPISYQHNCVFIHIPKTGGGSITKLLRITSNLRNYYYLDGLFIINFHDSINNYEGWSCPAHLPGPILKQLNPLAFEKFYKFSLVRNPYDRLLSEFCWVNRKSFKPEDANKEFFVQKFKCWVDNLSEVLCQEQLLLNLGLGLSGTPSKRIPSHLIPQHYFLYEKDKLIVDEVFKFEETIEVILRKLSSKLNLNYIPAHLNKNTFEINKDLFLTPETKEKIYNLYTKDFQMLGYDK